MSTPKKSVSISSWKNGGKRPGAGRKPGSHNKKTAAVIKAVEETGITPLEFMLQVMREPLPELPKVEEVGVEAYVAAAAARDKAKATALDAAKSAAPYCHARLQAIEVSGKDGKDLMPDIFQLGNLRNLEPSELVKLKDMLAKIGQRIPA